MKKVMLFALPALLFAFGGCKKAAKKAEEIKQEIINGYWEAADGVVVAVSEDQAVVVEFGASNLGTNSSVFKVGDAFIRDIERTGPNNWNAEVIKPTFDANNKLTSITYVPTSITTETSGSTNSTSILKIENATPAYQSWSAPAGSGSGNNNTEPSCDTTSEMVVDPGNYMKTIEFGWNEHTYTGTTVKCGYKRWGRQCVYYFDTEDLYNGARDIELYFKEKPQAGRTYKMIPSGLNTIIKEDEAIVVVEPYGSNWPDQHLTISIENGKLKAEASGLILNANQELSFAIYGN